MSHPRNSRAAAALAGILWAGLCQAQPASQPIPQLQNVFIKQKLNSKVPLDLVFQDETGRTVPLRSYFGKKPVVLSLVYYQCPMLCNMVLNGLSKALKVLKFNVGNEFDVLTISFDDRETPALAAAKKEGYLEAYARPGAGIGWHFLTGRKSEIIRLANAVGFGFEYDAARNQFAHASAIMVLTPDGVVSKYFYGIEYSARELRMALVEASAGKIGTPVDQMLMYCFHYDPQTGKYSANILNIVRAGGIATLFGIAAMFIVMTQRDRQARAGVAL